MNSEFRLAIRRRPGFAIAGLLRPSAVAEAAANRLAMTLACVSQPIVIARNLTGEHPLDRKWVIARASPKPWATAGARQAR